MQNLINAINASETLSAEGTVSEYLPQYAELTYQFSAGLTVRVAHHGGDKFQATLNGCYYLEQCTAPELLEYLESLVTACNTR